MDSIKIEDEDLYELLGLDVSSSILDIKKAYRKKALQLHPDKNPDNPNAALEFHKLTKILEILTDAAARKAYDRVLKGRKEAAIRHQQLDDKRKKLKQDLETREKNSAKQKSASESLKEEIERLRKEGSKQVQEEMDYVVSQIHAEKSKVGDAFDGGKYRIKMKWNAGKDDVNNGGYSQENLHKFLSKYGDVVVLVISSKKKGSGLVEFSTKRAAEMAVDFEKGLSTNPLRMEWLNKIATVSRPQSSTIKDTDFESVVLTRMRQAEERRRLIEKMMAEDNACDD